MDATRRFVRCWPLTPEVKQIKQLVNCEPALVPTMPKKEQAVTSWFEDASVKRPVTWYNRPCDNSAIDRHERENNKRREDYTSHALSE